MISRYKKLSKEYVELSKTHTGLKEMKQQWKGEVEQDSKNGAMLHIRGTDVATSLISSDARLVGDEDILDNVVLKFSWNRYPVISSAVSYR